MLEAARILAFFLSPLPPQEAHGEMVRETELDERPGGEERPGEVKALSTFTPISKGEGKGGGRRGGRREGSHLQGRQEKGIPESQFPPDLTTQHGEGTWPPSRSAWGMTRTRCCEGAGAALAPLNLTCWAKHLCQPKRPGGRGCGRTPGPSGARAPWLGKETPDSHCPFLQDCIMNSEIVHVGQLTGTEER